MTLLVDTHALLWLGAADPRLSRPAEAVLRDPHNRIFFSAYGVQRIW
jgi:PIN domain nuclease of toxin-antitoxin system